MAQSSHLTRSHRSCHACRASQVCDRAPRDCITAATAAGRQGSMRRFDAAARCGAVQVSARLSTAHQPTRPRCSALPPVGSARLLALLGATRRGSMRRGVTRHGAGRAKRAMRRGSAWGGVPRLSSAWLVAAWRGAAWRSTAWHGTVRHGIRRSAARWTRLVATRCGSMRRNTATGLGGLGRGGLRVEWRAVARRGAAWHRAARLSLRPDHHLARTTASSPPLHPPHGRTFQICVARDESVSTRVGCLCGALWMLVTLVGEWILRGPWLCPICVSSCTRPPHVDRNPCTCTCV